jgi:hypothetical protein
MQIHRPRSKATTTALTGTALVALLLLGGCGGNPNTPGTPTTVSLSTTAPQPSGRPTTTPTAVPTSPGAGLTATLPEPTATTPIGAVQLSEPSAGRTFQIHRGDRVVLTLHNTYWRIAPPDGRILTQTGTQKVTPARAGTCRPGLGCGTVQAIFIASATGSTELTASRTTCGEAMACPPGQGSYVTHLIVR